VNQYWTIRMLTFSITIIIKISTYNEIIIECHVHGDCGVVERGLFNNAIIAHGTRSVRKWFKFNSIFRVEYVQLDPCVIADIAGNYNWPSSPEHPGLSTVKPFQLFLRVRKYFKRPFFLFTVPYLKKNSSFFTYFSWKQFLK